MTFILSILLMCVIIVHHPLFSNSPHVFSLSLASLLVNCCFSAPARGNQCLTLLAALLARNLLTIDMSSPPNVPLELGGRVLD